MAWQKQCEAVGAHEKRMRLADAWLLLKPKTVELEANGRPSFDEAAAVSRLPVLSGRRPTAVGH